jgi:putative nucleotidyltransferase with HDIG domain
MTLIEDTLKKVTDVPTLPTSVLEVLQLLEYSDCSVTDLVKVINRDPSMAAKVLKIANSSFYGFRHSIGTINQAITILGFSTLKNALLSMSVFDLFSNVHKGIDLPGLWTHSVGTATAAKILAQRLRYPNGEKAYTAGLLHDIGKIIIANYLPAAALEAINMSTVQKVKLESAELHILGATHADVGAWLLNRWKLPSHTVDAVRLHHQPTLSQDNFELTGIVYLANILCHHAKVGNSGDRDDLIIDNRVFSYCKFSEADWVEMRDVLASKKPEIYAFLQTSVRAA